MRKCDGLAWAADPNRGRVSSTNSQVEDEPIGVVVVGAGYWGPNLVRNFMASPAFSLRALCDLDVNRARKVLGSYSTVQATNDLSAALADPSVQAVAIATPAGTH